jgi:uroporphyrinogen-III synthase
VLSRAYLVGRGPRPAPRSASAGLHDQWSPEGESYEEVVDHLDGRGVAGLTVAMQLHGESQPEYTEALEAAGAG